ncbi:pyridoxal phosphate-dependent aminotransferase [Actinomycetaceae bacterium MB13-C1-2]|nr:pyridoxal phosphate-dependent aminotransferase [Actinomycetaceae bacterium MB13-C1-2]
MSKSLNHRASARLSAIAPSATLAVDAKSKAMKAAGEPVINFAPGEPDFPTPEHIVQAALQAVTDPASHKYTPASGLPALRQAIADRVGVFGDAPLSPADVIVTNGGKQAVFQACAAIIDDGDEVLLPAPYWTTYPETIQLAGGVTVPVETTYQTDYKVTVDQLEAARTDKTIAMILCSPSNPTGGVYTPEEIRAIGEWALENGVWIISDEIYDQLTYDGTVAEPVWRAVPEVANQTIVVNGVAKSYSMTGWRVGWMFGPSDVIKVANAFQSHLSSNVNNIAQKAAIAALTGPQEPVEQMREAFDRRRKLIVELLKEIGGFDVPTPTGAFYVYPYVGRVLGKTIGGVKVESSSDLAEVILDQAQVAVVPGEAFGTPGYLRLSYAVSDEDIAEGIGRIEKLMSTAE